VFKRGGLYAGEGVLHPGEQGRGPLKRQRAFFEIGADEGHKRTLIYWSAGRQRKVLNEELNNFSWLGGLALGGPWTEDECGTKKGGEKK